MEHLQLTDDDKIPNIEGQSIVETNVEYYKTSHGTHLVKHVKDKYENGVCRIIIFNFNDAHSNFNFEQIIIDGDLREYRAWDKKGRKEKRSFQKSISGEMIYDGPKQSWFSTGNINTNEYYCDGKLVVSYEHTGFRLIRTTRVYSNDNIEILEEYKDGGWKYSINYK